MMISAKDAAQKLKITEQQVRNLIRKGELHATMVGKQWVIQTAELDSYIQENSIVIEPDDHPRCSEKLPDIVALSFFSGAMGLDIGMQNAGIDAVLACEFDKACRMTIQSNNPEIGLIGDITKFSAEDILQMARIPQNRKVDVVFGGPPCQAFSTAGARRGFNDTRGNVFLKYIELIKEILPTYVVIENVRGLLSAPFPYSDTVDVDEYIGSDEPSIKGGALLYIIKRLREAGYTISFNLYNAANYGAPQVRERVVIIGCLGKDRVPYLRPTHSENGEYGLPRWRTLADALKALPDGVKHHHLSFPECRLKYYRLLKEGQYWKNLPVELQKEAMGHSFFLGGGKTGFYRRLAYYKPSPTLVTNPTMPATDLAHPIEDRPLSVEEYHCIQEFPPSWQICGSLLDQYRQIGNAVPIKLGEAIGHTITDHMNGIPQTEIAGFQYSRYKNTDETSWEKEVRRRIKTEKAEQLSLI